MKEISQNSFFKDIESNIVEDREEKDIAKKDFQHEENINAPYRMKEVN